MAEWGLAHLVEDALILISELATNALKASWNLPNRPPIVLRLLANDRRLIVEVWDQNPNDVEPQKVTADAECGRGLIVVAAVSDRWGSKRTGCRRKVVWAELSR